MDYLQQHGASFFPSLHTGIGGGFPTEVVDALWSLVWRGLVTNDTLQALRAFVEPPKRARRPEPAPFRSRRVTPPEAQGRWSLVAERLRSRPSATEWATAVARQLLARHGVLTREAMNVEAIPGGYSAVYDVLRALEDAGARGAACSWAASAPRSSRCRRPSICCARCANRRRHR
jgi:ATP-dependent Lhr-like helicase